MRALILGSTGMVGSEVLKECIANPFIDDITVVNRESESSIKDEKVKEVVLSNFPDFESIKEKIIGHEICFYCIGVYTGSASEDKFAEITCKYVEELVKVISSKEIIFCLFSADGANTESKIMFAKYKGQAEEIIRKYEFKDIYIFRPAYIHPSDKARMHKSLLYKVMYYVYPIVRPLKKYCITSHELANVMVKVAVDGNEKKIFSNSDMRDFV